MLGSKHKWLVDILGYRPFAFKLVDDKHIAQHMKHQYKTFGVTSQECFNMDNTMTYSLYEHLKMYLRDADNIVDLHFYSFNIPVAYLNDKHEEIESRARIQTNGQPKELKKYAPKYITKLEWHDQKECIELMISYIEDWMRADVLDEDDEYEKVKVAWEIWGVMFPTMWS